MKKKKEPVYGLTPYGVISTTTNDDEARKIIDALELYMVRAGYNAILINKGEAKFINVVYETAKKHL